MCNIYNSRHQLINAWTCEESNLINRIFKMNNESDSLQELREKFGDCFGEISTTVNSSHHTQHKDIKPVIHLLVTKRNYLSFL